MTTHQNINFVYDNDLCHYCGICYGVCPKDNISVKPSNSGNPIFRVADVDQCLGCNLCYRACPGFEFDNERIHQEVYGVPYDFSLLGKFQECFLGHSTDITIRRNSASGGLVSSLVMWALDKKLIDGAVMVRMKEHGDPLDTDLYIARSRDDMLQARGSKYITVPLDMAVREIWESQMEERFALVGLPCHIHGLRKAQQFNPRLKRRIVLTIAIFCGRGTNPMGSVYAMKKLGVRKEDVTKVEYRRGKWPGGFCVTLKDGSEKFMTLNDYIYIMKMFENLRCGLCTDLTGEFADISTGDAWLPELQGQEGWNILLTRSDFGVDVLKRAAADGCVHLESTRPEKICESQRLMLYDRKQLVFPLMQVARFLGLKNIIPKYTGVPSHARLSFHGYVRAIIFFVIPRIADKREWRWLLGLMIRLPQKILKMDFKIKARLVKGELKTQDIHGAK